ncbi:hypothetical protein FACS1894111_09620 [Clostridia bacterium]|nr:hypothetical protein FACS1894111_09620 [Clostridia bacterium]
MKRNRKSILVKRIVTAVLVLMWMILISSFSAQNGQQSGGLSKKVAKNVVETQEKLLKKKWDSKQKEAKILALQFPVRKTAHMTEYGILAVLLMFHFSCYLIRNPGNNSKRTDKELFQLADALDDYHDSKVCHRIPWKCRLALAELLVFLYAAGDELHQRFVAGRTGCWQDVVIDGIGGGIFLLLLSLAHRIYRLHIAK